MTSKNNSQGDNGAVEAAIERKQHQLSRRQLIQNCSVLGAGLALPGLPLYAQDQRITSPSSIIKTRAGQIQGLQAVNGVQAFYGVPYGASTDGENRFKLAADPAPWSGVKQCTQVGDRSPQTSGGPIPEVFALDRTEAMSEDCLRINVYTPNTESADRPVMVWLHGGGYTSGSGGWILYDGSMLASTQDVVVVTVNHRLNVFGHLYLAGLGGEAYADSGNAGMMDIVKVLQWVRDNIAAFGGNADNVTIFGQSGGAGKVSTLLAMPAAKGLFHKAIAMSGAALSSISPEAATQTTERVMAALELSPKQVNKLSELPTRALLDAYLNTPGLNLGPVRDGKLIPADPFNPAASELSAQIPLMMGSTEHEVNFMPFTPLENMDDAALLSQLSASLKRSESATRELIALYQKGRPAASNVELYQIISTDDTFRRGVTKQIELKSAQQAPVYFYYFTWRSPVREGKLRAYHCLDIPFAFNNVDNCAAMVGAAQERYALASAMSGAFASFARTGNPNHQGLPQWPRFDTTTRATMIFNNTPAVVNDPYSAERRAMYEA